MAYCTSSDIQGAIGGAAALKLLTDIRNTTTDTTAITSAIDEATGVIDQYATGTPGTTGVAGAMWSSTPIPATQSAINIAVYTLYMRIHREVPEDWRTKYERTMDLLEKLSQGKVSWVASENPSMQTAATVYYFGPGSTARTDNPRRARRDQLDKI